MENWRLVYTKEYLLYMLFLDQYLIRSVEILFWVLLVENSRCRLYQSGVMF